MYCTWPFKARQHNCIYTGQSISKFISATNYKALIYATGSQRTLKVLADTVKALVNAKGLIKNNPKHQFKLKIPDCCKLPDKPKNIHVSAQQLF